jgi:hypothetical protein
MRYTGLVVVQRGVVLLLEGRIVLSERLREAT